MNLETLHELAAAADLLDVHPYDKQAAIARLIADGRAEVVVVMQREVFSIASEGPRNAMATAPNKKNPNAPGSTEASGERREMTDGRDNGTNA